MVWPALAEEVCCSLVWSEVGRRFSFVGESSSGLRRIITYLSLSEYWYQ